MRETESIQCPFCGQECTVPIDTGVRSQRFITDCEVCCRPFEVVAECEDGEVVSVDVLPG
jgi:transposase-like protein